MQRGVPPSVVEDAIRIRPGEPGLTPGTVVHHDPVNNLSVAVDVATGKVITTSFGQLKVPK